MDVDSAVDVELLHRIAAGDVDAHRQLYERHAAAVFAFLVARTGDREQAEDVLQEVMIAVWKGAHGFRGESAARTWLISIAAHLASRVLRASARTAPDTGAPTRRAEPSPYRLDGDERLDVAAAIAALPEAQRTVVVLFFYDGQSIEAIGAILNVPLGTVKSRLFRAKAALKEALQTEPSRLGRRPRPAAAITDALTPEGLGDVR